MRQRFGRWQVIFELPRRPDRKSVWECRCVCGRKGRVLGQHLINGRSRSCGVCLRHGKTGCKEWKAWQQMKTRCYNKKRRNYRYYGGRGIHVCKRWLHSSKGFLNFYEDVGRAPSKKHSIDRERVNGHYTPRNVRWATKAQQAANQRRWK